MNFRSPRALVILHPVTLLLLLPLAGSASRLAASSGEPGVGERQCTYGEWTEPVPIRDLPAGVVVRDPELAVGQEAIVLGNDVPNFEDKPVPPGPLLAIQLRTGSSIGKPSGRFWFVSPKAVMDAQNTLHVVWAEPDSVERISQVEWPTSPVTSLWYATYSRRVGWSAPREIHRVRGPDAFLNWRGESASIALDTDARLHVAVEDFIGGGLFHVVVSDQVASQLVTDTGGSYAQLAIGPAGQVYIGYMGLGRESGGAGNDAFIVRSPDGGRTWSQPTLIPSSIREDVTRIRLLAAPDGVVHLLWGHSPNAGAITSSRISHVVSRDGGVSWFESEGLDIGREFHHLWAAVDRCGAVHVAFEAWDTGVGDMSKKSIGYARRERTWTPAVYPFQTITPLELALAIGPDDRVRLFFSGRPRQTQGPEPWFGGMTSALRVTMIESRRPGR